MIEDYKRLTKRNYFNGDYCVVPEELSKEITKWKEQHATEMTAPPVWYHLGERLCQLETKIENGTLVDCPYKLGTELHFIVLNKHSGEFEIFTTEFWAYVSRYKDEFGGVEFAIEIIDVDFDNDTLIEVCHFLTKPEAEAKLRELKEKDNEQK